MWLADLLALWQAHGTGLVAKHALLHFQDGALTAPSPASGILGPRNHQPLSTTEHQARHPAIGVCPVHPGSVLHVLSPLLMQEAV